MGIKIEAEVLAYSSFSLDVGEMERRSVWDPPGVSLKTANHEGNFTVKFVKESLINTSPRRP
jgi:hypothetical protein